jgi:hypothetical protein
MLWVVNVNAVDIFLLGNHSLVKIYRTLRWLALFLYWRSFYRLKNWLR